MLEFLNRVLFQWFFFRLGTGRTKSTNKLIFVGVMFPVVPLTGYGSPHIPKKPSIHTIWRAKQATAQTKLPPDLLMTIPVYGADLKEALRIARELAADELYLLQNQLYRREVAYELIDVAPNEEYELEETREKAKALKVLHGFNVDVHGRKHYIARVWGYFKSVQVLKKEKDDALVKEVFDKFEPGSP